MSGANRTVRPKSSVGELIEPGSSLLAIVGQVAAVSRVRLVSLAASDLGRPPACKRGLVRFGSELKQLLTCGGVHRRPAVCDAVVTHLVTQSAGRTSAVLRRHRADYVFRVERLLADFSLTGNILTRSIGILRGPSQVSRSIALRDWRDSVIDEVVARRPAPIILCACPAPAAIWVRDDKSSGSLRAPLKTQSKFRQ